MKIKIQIKSLAGSVLFEFESENNTIRKTVEKAIEQKADLRYADLSYANLRSADLSYANLRYADLRYANLSYANLSYANLSYANLRYADLRYANLSYANLRYADLSYANLSYANLRYADLRSADLRYANLSYANLSYADLRSANLSYADLSYADLRSAENSELAVAMTRILPEGDLIGYKQCQDKIIVKLSIPKEAKRSSAFGRKCRAEFAQVLEIFGATEARSLQDSSFLYHVGDTVRPTKPFDEDFTVECSTGIHFYITRLEAETN